MLLIITFTSINAQLYTPNATIQGGTGNSWVGIGTSNTQGQLHIQNRDGTALLLDAGQAQGIGGSTSTDYPLEMRFTNPQLGGQAVRFRMHNNGRLDIGRTYSSQETFAANRLNLNGGIQIFGANATYSFLDQERIRWSGFDKFHFSYYDPIQESDQTVFRLNAQGPSYLNGALGINTAQTPPGYKLYVGGKVLCEELTVKLEQEWPDYVFKEDYERMSLKEVEAYITKHKHLPGIPDAEEVADKGVDVGQLNAILLKKIEELTLEMIEMKKEMKELKK